MRVRDLKSKAQSIWRLPSLLLAIALMPVGRVQGQGTFQNLNFEAANVSGYPVNASDVPIIAALPGWSGYFTDPLSGTQQTSQVWHDSLSAGGSMIAVDDVNTGFGFAPLQGTFSAYLATGGGLRSTAISQTGLVPVGTKSLLVEAQASGAAFAVSLGGHTIGMIPLQNFPNYVLYGGDVSALANQTAALNFTLGPPAFAPPSSLILDSIVFSPNAIPEPGTWALLLCGAVVFGWRRYANSRFKI